MGPRCASNPIHEIERVACAGLHGSHRRRIIGVQPDRCRVDDDVERFALVPHVKRPTDPARLISQFLETSGRPVPNGNGSGTELVQAYNNGAGCATGAEHENASVPYIARKRRERRLESGDIGVVAADPAVFQPEGVARAGEYQFFGSGFDDFCRYRLVRNRYVAAVAGPRELTHEARDLIHFTLQRDVGRAKIRGHERGTLKDR